MKSFNNWIPALVVMLVIFISSSTTGKTIVAVGANRAYIQFFGHFIMFFSLIFAYYKAIKNIPESIILALFYAVFDELHQLFTLLRNPSIYDLKIDTFAALLGGLLLWKLQHTLPKKLKTWLNN